MEYFISSIERERVASVENSKTEQEDSPGPIPPALAVHAKDILLLKDNAYE